MPIPSPIAKYNIADSSSYSGTGNTVYDLSPNNYDLSLTDTTFENSSGIKSLIFNGSSSKAIYLGNIGVSTGDPFTFFIWTNIISVSGPYNIFLSYGQDDAIPLVAGRYAGNTEIIFETGSGSNLIDPNISTDLNVWHSYCVTYDTTTYKLYYDGILEGSVSGSRNIGTPTKLSIGCFDSTGGYFTNMKFQYFEAFDSALSASDVLSINNNTNPLNPPPAPYVGSVGGRRFGGRFNG